MVYVLKFVVILLILVGVGQILTIWTLLFLIGHTHQQIQKTKTLPFVITANNGNEEKEDGYDDWLRARLESTLQKLQSGEMKRYTHNEAMSLLDEMVESRVKSRTK